MNPNTCVLDSHIIALIMLKKYMLKTYICIELPDKTREVVVLEIHGKQILGKVCLVPNHKTATILTP